MKKFIIAFFTYIILVFIIAGVWHLALFNEVYLQFGFRKEPLFLLGTISVIIQAISVAYLYPKVANENAPIKEGLKFGLLIGFFMGSYGVLAEAGKYDVGNVTSFILHEGAFFLIQFAIVGMVIGLIYGKSFKN